jgi:hypothetical protein
VACHDPCNSRSVNFFFEQHRVTKLSRFLAYAISDNILIISQKNNGILVFKRSVPP